MKKKDEIIWKNAWRLAQTKGWSKEDLAEKMKVRITSLNNIINGTRGIGPQMLEKIKLALGVDEDVLMVPLPIDDGTSTDIGNISKQQLTNHLIKYIPIQSKYAKEGGDEALVLPIEVVRVFSGNNEILKKMVVNYIIGVTAEIENVRLKESLLVDKNQTMEASKWRSRIDEKEAASDDPAEDLTPLGGF